MIILLSVLILIDGLSLSLFNNPIHCVYILILLVIKLSMCFLILKCEFLGLILMLVYLGAVAVLFIFIVMMLNIKLLVLSPLLNNYIIVSILTLMFVYPFIDILFDYNKLNIIMKSKQINLWIFFIDDLSLVVSLGSSLYTLYFVVLLLVSLILFVSMLGALFLTLEKKKPGYKKQDILFQIYSNQKLYKYWKTNKINLEKINNF